METPFLLAAILLACLAHAQAAIVWADFRARLAGITDTSRYSQLARTLDDANSWGYVSPPEESGCTACSAGAPLFTTLCPMQDPSVCLLYDQNGFIAGMEFGIVKFHAPKGYPFAKTPAFVSKQRFGYQCWINTFYFVDQKTINSGGRTTMDETGKAIWMQNGNNNLLAIPRLEADLKGTPWVKQTCSSGTGDIYQYAMNSTLACEKVLPVMAFYKASELHGFAWQVFGASTPKGLTWLETNTASSLASVTPTAPTCLNTFVNNYGFISLHVYFTVSPWYINCLF